MRILYLTSQGEDYLQDQLLIGARNLYGDAVVDYPKKDVLYKTCATPKIKMYGRGFTLYKTLEDINIDRDNIIQRVGDREFDLVIFGSIWRELEIFHEFLKKNIFFARKAKIFFIDGEDFNSIIIKLIFLGKYFKREWKSGINVPFVNKISFSIPKSRILPNKPDKDKNFARHIQCREAYKVEEIKRNCSVDYVFSEENEYYKDLSRSKYAVTMKKGGWDCMRHYEIAANFTVPCFYKFLEKPKNCAPHDLIDMKNVISFNTADELTKKIAYVENNGLYERMQDNVIRWVNTKTCEYMAKTLICEYESTGR